MKPPKHGTKAFLNGWLRAMTYFILDGSQLPLTMAEAAPVTDKSLQLKVLGALALFSIILMGGVQLFLETTNLRYASLALLGGVLLLIFYLAIDL